MFTSREKPKTRRRTTLQAAGIGGVKSREMLVVGRPGRTRSVRCAGRLRPTLQVIRRAGLPVASRARRQRQHHDVSAVDAVRLAGLWPAPARGRQRQPKQPFTAKPRAAARQPISAANRCPALSPAAGVARAPLSLLPTANSPALVPIGACALAPATRLDSNAAASICLFFSPPQQQHSNTNNNTSITNDTRPRLLPLDQLAPISCSSISPVISASH